MPEISRFHGIVIAMFYNEHGAAHFHAIYNEHKATIEIESGRINGYLPNPTLGLVLAWSRFHRDELRNNWNRARAGEPLDHIEPLL